MVAMEPDISTRFLLQSPLPCESEEQSAENPAEPRSGLRAHDEPSLRVPPLPERAGGRRRQDDLVAGARRAVPSECRADPEGPRVFRRVRRARRRLLRPRPEAPPAADPRAGPEAARRDHGRRQPRPRARRLPGLPPGRVRDLRALRQPEREGRPALARRRADSRHPRPEEDGAGRRHQHRGHRRPGALRSARPQPGRRLRHQGGAELLARHARRAAGGEAEERRSHRVAREPVVLPRAGGDGQ